MPSESGLFAALEEVLKTADRPMDCHELFEDSRVRAHAAHVNRVSDYLGNLWRKGNLTRLPTVRGESRARWMYQWKDQRSTPQARRSAAAYLGGAGVEVLAHHPEVKVLQQGSDVIIDLPTVSVIIRSKS